jgi:phage tail-like protein
MAIGVRNDPYLACNFLVEIDNLVVGGFSEVSGLRIETEVKDYREGGENDFVHKLPGPTLYPSNLILKHGIADSTVLWDWYQDVTLGVITRRSGAIILLDATGDKVWRWDFFDAYPVRWIGPDFRADSAAVAVETIELVHHGLY